MPTITASMVKELRDRTDVAMMKCKKALEECDGDIEAAVEHLRKTAGAAQDKKAGRETKAGGLGMAIGDGAGVLLMLSCETDFVSGNEQFKEFVNRLAQVALDGAVTDLEALQQQQLDGQAVPEALAQAVQKLGENIQLAAIHRLTGEVVTGYNHGGRVAALVAGTGEAETLRNVAMHVAAANPVPVSLDREGVPAELVDKERAIIAESPEIQSKPEQIRPKIVEGKMGRFYKEHVLLEQEMLVDSDGGDSVEQWAKAKGVSVTGFVRADV